MKPEIKIQVTGYGALGTKTRYYSSRMAYCTECDYDLKCIDYGIKDLNYCQKCGVKIDWSEIEK